MPRVSVVDMFQVDFGEMMSDPSYFRKPWLLEV